jgi:hypothetical protein
VYLLYCSPKPVVKAGATTIATTSKEKQPSLLNEPLINAIVSSDHNELPPREDSVNQIIEMELQQAAANKTADSTLMEEAKEHAIGYANKNGNADANRAAEAEKITNTTEAQKLAEVMKANVAEVAEKAEAASKAKGSASGLPRDVPEPPERAPTLKP